MDAAVYRCGSCRKLLHADHDADGDRCPLCEMGHLRRLPGQPSQRQLREHETALDAPAGRRPYG